MDVDKLVPEAGNLEGFIEQFDVFAGAPDGVEELRKLILDLAVQGKLVAHHNHTFSGHSLLIDIETEKKRLSKLGGLKKAKVPIPISSTEKPFNVPESWAWARLGSLGYTQTGGTPKKTNSNHYGSDIPFIKPGDILHSNIKYDNIGLSFEGEKALGRTAPAGSVLMVCIGTIGKCSWIDRSCSFNQQINSVTPYSKITEYLHCALRSSYFQKKAWALSSSTTLAILNKGKWESIVIPLPPLEEQKRIVAKVDELMALCDKLEAQQQQQAHNVLRANTAVIHALLNPEPPQTEKTQKTTATVSGSNTQTQFEKNWQRIAQHFNTLYGCTLTMPDGEGRKKKHLVGLENVKALRQVILQLAVCGRLSIKSAGDSTTKELIKMASEALVNIGKAQGYKVTKKFEDSEFSVLLPEHWCRVRLGEIAFVKGGKRLPKGHQLTNTLTAYKYIRVRDFKNLSVDVNNLMFLKKDTYELIKKYTISKSDIYLTIVGATIGKLGTIPDELDGSNLTENAAKIVFEHIDQRYLVTAMQSPLIQKQFFDYINQQAQPKLALKRIESVYIPLPSLEEQKRIVSKVDQLMTLCDQLEQQLTQSYSDAEKLMQATVKALVN